MSFGLVYNILMRTVKEKGGTVGRPKGFVMTEESKLKISLKKSGIPLTKTHKSSISKSMTGVKKSKKHAKNVSIALKGVKKNLTDEGRKSLSKFQKERWIEWRKKNKSGAKV